jgi:hypothetical protein
MWWTMLGLALLSLVLTSRPAAAQLGGTLVATGGTASVTVLPATAGYTSRLYLKNPDPSQPDIFLATNHDVGTTVSIPTYPAGTPLEFYIFVTNTGYTYYMGDGTNNPDGIPHAVVTATGPGQAIVGFEDLYGGGDQDYDDNVFRFEGVTPDVTPPTISDCSVNPNVLWQPNHRMVDVTVSYTVTDDMDDPSEITTSISVTSNEPDNGLGDGDTANDIEVIDAHHVRLRAERSGKGEGRIYTVTITATDSSGNTSTETCTVTVPHDKRK